MLFYISLFKFLFCYFIFYYLNFLFLFVCDLTVIWRAVKLCFVVENNDNKDLFYSILFEKIFENELIVFFSLALFLYPSEFIQTTRGKIVPEERKQASEEVQLQVRSQCPYVNMLRSTKYPYISLYVVMFKQWSLSYIHMRMLH